ncbi:site-specific integrase [Sulfurovum sp. XGS-02]|uniref:tyrosine-type recombinase/integrase n=1 Tax=Sulfurovum sp. XGS-02 TaxID=2925411 RepID=UPI0020701D03|nr:site-specific integrase [Sulfurovum sp. XGS-02]UPT77480.1 site-specific integrase [Sulfurovum sp. XGS-02]
MEATKLTHSFSAKEKHDNHLYDNVESRIADEFDVTHLLQDKTLTKKTIYFDKFPAWARKAVKYYIENEILLRNSTPSSANDLTIHLKGAFAYLQKHYDTNTLAEIHEQHFDSYIKHLEDRVRVEGSMKLKTAYSYTVAFMKFLEFVEDEEISSYPYLSKIEPAKIFPYDKPEKFFDGDSLKKHLANTQKNKDERPLSYSHLVEILECISDYNDVLFTNISIIMAHSGLRATEVLHLETDCLEYVTEEEMRISKNNRIPIDDKEELYWLSNYKTIKGKQKNWTIGTPILVGSEVKNAIDTLVEHSRDLLSKYEPMETKISNNICLLLYQGKTKILTYAGYRSKLKRFVSETGVKPFTAHQFRHTYASMLYDSGVPIEFIRKYLNHIHEDMTDGYIKKNKQKTMEKYESFASAKVFAGGGEKKAYELQNKLKEALEHPEFAAMIIEERLELLEILSDSLDMDIHAMDHGMCLIPKNATCPNNFIEINSCFEQNCQQFATTENSIPHFTRLIEYKEGWIEDFEKTGHWSAAERGRKGLEKNINILEKLKKGEYFVK